MLVVMIMYAMSDCLFNQHDCSEACAYDTPSRQDKRSYLFQPAWLTQLYSRLQ